MLKQPNHLIINTLLVLLSFSLLSCISKNSSENALPNHDKPAPQTKTAGNISRLETKNSFWSLPRKIKADQNSIVSLIYSKEKPESKIESQLIIYNNKTQQYVVHKVSSPQTILDFDITSDGKLVQLVSTETIKPEFEEFPLRELSIYVDQRIAFTFHDSKLNDSIKYDKNGLPHKVQPIEKDRTLFFVSSPLTEFARLQVNNNVIYLSAVGPLDLSFLLLRLVV